MRVVKHSYKILLWIQIIAACTSTTTMQPSQPLTSTSINKNLHTVMEAISALPTNRQPSNLKQSLMLMLEGGQIWKAITQNKPYNALTLTSLSSQNAQILQQALNNSDDRFWILIHKDPAVQEAIEHCNIPFTRDTSTMHEYKMLFRFTYIRVHITNPDILIQVQQAYRHAIIALQWFLFAQAILQDSIFTAGMLTIPDNQHYLFHFLDGYAELVSPRYRFYSGLHPHSLWQPNAYTRSSSYWKNKKQFHDSMFGIDFQDNDHQSIPVLPNQNSHLLFCALDNGMTAIKWERFGVTLNIKNRTFSALKQPLRYFQKNNQNTDIIRKEKIPQDVMLQFKSLFNNHLTKYQSDQINKDGITAMLNMLDSSGRSIFIDFLTKRKKYSSLTLTLRKGNEIILQPSHFKNLSAA